ncbi:MAG: InlB B-repeat-containing protein [Lawsonibacter sp.]|nr:InlB B-repeat-containing protein [Lawsonibacter sp.]
MFTSTRYGYEFKGWYADKNYTQAVTDDREFSRGDILYAKWVKVADPPEDKTYTIIIDGGSSVTTGSDGKLTALPAAPTKPGYIFNGWYTGPDGTGTKVTTGYIFTGPTTIYPYWKPESSQPSDKVYVIIIDGGNSVTTGSDGKLTALPTAPTKPGYIFDGWYTQPDSGDRVTTDYIFTGPITIYPHWRPASSSTYYRVYTPDYIRGGSLYVSHNYALPGTQVTVEVSPRRDYYLDWLAVTNLSTGRDLYLTEYDWDEYTFTMPSSDVEVDLSYLDDYYSPSYYSPYTSGGYVSVTQTQVDSKPVQWYYSGGSIYHVTDGLVPTGALLTRDMLLSVLYNMDDTSSGGPIFWASKNHIVPDIYESWLWGVDKSITREQAAMILYCYAQHKGYSTFQRATITGYPDYNQIRSAARPAMSWAQASGLLTDFSSRALSPRNTLTCGQANSMLYRFVSNVTWGR